MIRSTYTYNTVATTWTYRAPLSQGQRTDSPSQSPMTHAKSYMISSEHLRSHSKRLHPHTHMPLGWLYQIDKSTNLDKRDRGAVWPLTRST
jgi:hypothetical protein